MTKTVRIENADTAPYRVRVIVQDRANDGTWLDVHVHRLDHSTAMVSEYLTSTRRFIVEEVPNG